MANVEKASGIYPARPYRKWTGRWNIEEIIAKKRDVSVIHENEQQSQKASKCRESRKLYLETFAETSKRTAETNNEEYTKKKKRTR